MTLVFGKKTLFSLLLGLDLLANILELTQVNFLGISTLLSLFTCILLPGILISLIFRLRKLSFWENLLLVVGLSLAFLQVGGLLLNILFPLIGVSDPLAFQNLIIGLDAYFLLLFVFAWIRTRQITVRVQFPQRSNIEKMLYALPPFFPILAALGAIILNNGGSNTLTMIMLGAIVVYIVLLMFLRNKITVDLYPYALFFMALACLFITSLRSWYISGHDIEREYYVFQLTNTHHFWSMAFYQDAYTACLSITILPTILANLSFIPDMYIYKVVFQILFALAPVLTFLIVKKYATSLVAFLSAFLFITFPTFFTDMAMLNRQEIGYIFFGLTLYVMLERTRILPAYDQMDTISMPAASADPSKLNTVALPAASADPSKLNTVALPTASADFSRFNTFAMPVFTVEQPLLMRRILFIIFAISVILAHYSTNFVSLMSVLFIYVFMKILSLPFIKRFLTSPFSKIQVSKQFLNLPLIVILIAATYVWNNLYTHASGDHVQSVLAEVVNSFFVRSSNDKASDLSYSIFFAPKIDPNQELQNYIHTSIQATHPDDAKDSQFYSKAITDKYPIKRLTLEELPPTPLGGWLSSLGVPVFDVQNNLKLFSGYVMQIFLFVGLFAFFPFKRKKVANEKKKPFDEKNLIDLQFLLLCFSAIFLLFLITVLPALSLEYGVLRMFQQFLFVFSLPIVLGLNFLFFFMKEQKRILYTGMITILLFLNLSGFFAHLTGEFSPVMWLDNSGLYYDIYYVHKTDVFAIVWLSDNHTEGDPVEADETHGHIILDYGHIVASKDVIPPVIPKNGYVFVPLSSSVIVWGDTPILINTPKQFLDDNKNLIYSNGGDDIYR
jgi:uncharacterized membrane protein